MNQDICLAVPTRNRPTNMIRMFRSFVEHAKQPNSINIIFYIDDDDDQSQFGLNKLQKKYGKEQVRAIIGPRITLSQTHTECYKISESGICCYTGDDVCCETQDFDEIVRKKINCYASKIVLIAPADGYNPDTATTGFMHRNWVNCTGYVTPPYFGADWADRFLTEVALGINRFSRINDIMIRHYHPAAMPEVSVDLTMAEKIARGNAFGNGQLFYSRPIQDALQNDILKLKNFMEIFGESN